LEGVSESTKRKRYCPGLTGRGGEEYKRLTVSGDSVRKTSVLSLTAVMNQAFQKLAFVP
jgi:hypothetical protein